MSTTPIVQPVVATPVVATPVAATPVVATPPTPEQLLATMTGRVFASTVPRTNTKVAYSFHIGHITPVLGWVYAAYRYFTSGTEAEITANAAAIADEDNAKALNDATAALVNSTVARILFRREMEEPTEMPQQKSLSPKELLETDAKICTAKNDVEKFCETFNKRMEKLGIAIGTPDHKLAMQAACNKIKGNSTDPRLNTALTTFQEGIYTSYVKSLVNAYTNANAVTEASVQANIALLTAFVPGNTADQIRDSLYIALKAKFPEEFLTLANAQTAAMGVTAPTAAEITAQEASQRVVVQGQLDAINAEMAALRGPQTTDPLTSYQRGSIYTAIEAVTPLVATRDAAYAGVVTAYNASYANPIALGSVQDVLTFTFPTNQTALIAAQAAAIAARDAVVAAELVVTTRRNRLAAITSFTGSEPTGGQRGAFMAQLADAAAITALATTAAQTAVTARQAEAARLNTFYTALHGAAAE